jgi:predicted  nucleic acid-binding Zn-ribbon protein
MDILTIINTFISGILGYILGRINFKSEVKKGNINLKRDRLLENIRKAEDYIQLLDEYEFLINDSNHLNELIDYVNNNSDQIEKQQKQIQDEITWLQNKFVNHPDSRNSVDARIRLENLGSKLHDVDEQIQQNEEKMEDIHNKLSRLDRMISKNKKRIVRDDIAPTILLIDPSGELTKYFNELQEICLDQKNLKSSRRNIIELKVKIGNSINKQISNIK